MIKALHQMGEYMIDAEVSDVPRPLEHVLQAVNQGDI